MPSLFEIYERLSTSGEFDADFYARANPDIVAQNIDPLMHYVEIGCRERRDPSAHFDTAYYLRQCAQSGELPDNPLFHYLTVGKARGLSGRADPPDTAESQLYIDVPRIIDGIAAVKVHDGLSIAGWALSRAGIAEISLLLDGRPAGRAYYGVRRPDVAAAYPQWKDSLKSGFALNLPAKGLTAGRHVVAVSARDGAGQVTRREFGVDVESAADDERRWLRRAMAQVEVDAKLAILDQLKWRPRFTVVMPAGSGKGLRSTLETLSRQAYPDWHLLPCARSASGGSKAKLRMLMDGFEDLMPRLVTALPLRGPGARGRYVLAIAPGDELGCDALLELALRCAFEPEADLIYADELRPNPIECTRGPFFKPDWSPDLLLSTNYIGRSWCASTGLLERCGLNARDLTARGEYDTVLRLTEAASCIRRLPKLLFSRCEAEGDDPPAERRALNAAIKRRKIAAQVMPGCATHYYRIRRSHRAQPLVSIIMPTCAAGGLIERCIATLRERTSYRNYEIIGVENIPQDRRPWKKWLDDHADAVVSIEEPFNWSRFNNRGAAQAKGTHFLFLNDDVEILDADWLDALIEHSLRPEVGVVGPQLLYPDRSVQHAGMTLDRIGRGRHAFRHLRQDEPGYFGLALSQRNVIGLTGACLMTRRDTFERLGRFERAHAVINGDLDYCLKSWSEGLLNVYTPHARLIHHELASRGALGEHYDAATFHGRWRDVILRGDPYFNPNLSLDQDLVQVEREPVEEIYTGRPLFARESIRRILVIKLDHIGDAITAIEPVRRLKRLFPEAKVTMLASRGTVPIWQGERSVDETLEFNFFHVRSSLGTIESDEGAMTDLAATLARKRFDLAIDLRKQPDTRHILEISGARIRAGFDNHGRFPWLDVGIEWDEDVPLRVKRAHVSEDLNMLVDALALRSEKAPAAGVIAPAPGPLMLAGGLAHHLFSKPLVCVHAGAGSETRQWPAAKFSELVDLLAGDDSLNVALIGGTDEREIASSVLQGAAERKNVFNLVGQLSLAQLQKLFSRAALFVGNNSGPQHLAAGMGLPTVGIHSGIADAREWGPAGPRAIAIRRHMSCSPCFIQKPKDCPRALACLTGLDSVEVYRCCQRLLLLAKPRYEKKPRAG